MAGHNLGIKQGHHPEKNGTFMWNLGEPGARFPGAAPNHPEALLEEPQAFQAVGGKTVGKRTNQPKPVVFCLFDP